MHLHPTKRRGALAQAQYDLRCEIELRQALERELDECAQALRDALRSKHARDVVKVYLEKYLDDATVEYALRRGTVQISLDPAQPPLTILSTSAVRTALLRLLLAARYEAKKGCPPPKPKPQRRRRARQR